ncbi:MAG: hypothetical protein ABS84_09735 [Rubrivivax sp. SCN 71-131]|nr:MAG: hypothetical protein ABS84_09735 [Rubrivivax sp. SCN 71-131]
MSLVDGPGRTGMASPGNQSQDLARADSNALRLAPCSASPMKLLTTWRSTGSAPTSSRMAFANPATDRASYRSGFTNRLPCATSARTSGTSCTPSSGIHSSLVSIRLARSIS